MATIENFDMGGGGFEITLENPSLEDLQDEEKKKKKKVSLSSSKIMSIIDSAYLLSVGPSWNGHFRVVHFDARGPFTFGLTDFFRKIDIININEDEVPHIERIKVPIMKELR